MINSLHVEMSAYFSSIYEYLYPPSPAAAAESLPWFVKAALPFTTAVDGLVAGALPSISTMETQAAVIGGSFAVFTAMYLVEARLQSAGKKAPKERHEWCTLFPSQLHASLVSLLGWVSLLSPVSCKSRGLSLISACLHNTY